MSENIKEEFYNDKFLLGHLKTIANYLVSTYDYKFLFSKLDRNYFVNYSSFTIGNSRIEYYFIIIFFIIYK